ncbi:hypothetical protein TNCV_3399111 [Trichonephila clavipes]|nr:hypothetical protein TNCV_3399111 [Trichonephila clavipes]
MMGFKPPIKDIPQRKSVRKTLPCLLPPPRLLTPPPAESISDSETEDEKARILLEVAEESMKMAAVEEYSSSPDNLLTVSGDGTWKTRGHSSLIGQTDDEPMHWFCPTNPNTWCKYNAAINNNLQKYKHKPSVAKAVRDVIKPVFADLSHQALLKKCLGEKFGLEINRNVCVPLAERDNRRIFTSRQRLLGIIFEARRAKKIKKSKEIELFQEQEGMSFILENFSVQLAPTLISKLTGKFLRITVQSDDEYETRSVPST